MQREESFNLIKSKFTARYTGFTLLEMIVAVGVFSFVAVISTGSLLMLTSAQRKAVALQEIQDNLRFTMDSMARDIQIGIRYYCQIFPSEELDVSGTSRNCAIDEGGGKMLTFKNQDSNWITYRLGNGAIEKLSRNNLDDPQIFFPITSSDVKITDLLFYVDGALSDDKTEPRITIIIDSTTSAERERADFHLQTTVSQRAKVRR